MQIECLSGLVASVRNIKGHELAALAEQAEGDTTPIDGITTIVGGCWLTTIDPGPYRIVTAGDAKPEYKRILKGDIIYSLLRLRASSVKTPDSTPGPWGPGDPYAFDVQCGASGCRKRYGWELLLSQLKRKELSEASRKTLNEGGVFETTVGGRRYTFQLQTPAIDEPMVKLRGQQKRKSASIVDTLTAQTITVEGLKSNDIRSRWNYIADLDNLELQELQEAYEDADCGIDTEIQTQCVHCRRIEDIELPLGRSFFRPKKPAAEEVEIEEETIQAPASPATPT